MKSLTIAVFALAVVSAVNVWQTMELKRAIPSAISRAQDRAEALAEYQEADAKAKAAGQKGEHDTYAAWAARAESRLADWKAMKEGK